MMERRFDQPVTDGAEQVPQEAMELSEAEIEELAARFLRTLNGDADAEIDFI